MKQILATALTLGLLSTSAFAGDAQVCAFHYDHDVVIPSYAAPEHQNGVLRRREGDQVIINERTNNSVHVIREISKGEGIVVDFWVRSINQKKGHVFEEGP